MIRVNIRPLFIYRKDGQWLGNRKGVEKMSDNQSHNCGLKKNHIWRLEWRTMLSNHELLRRPSFTGFP